MNGPQIRLRGIGADATSTPLDGRNEHMKSVEQRFLEHFGLSEQPFGVTPDPRFLYLGTKHRQALAALNYGTELNRGFLTLIAQPGMGKTSLLFNYLEGLRDKARTTFLFQTDCDSHELMPYMLADLGIDVKGKDLPEMHSILNRVLSEEMRSRRKFVLVIDEAQNLTERVLESVRLLSNFETPWMKLMQIVLAGQPQLAERLAKPSMAQFRQRISFAIQIEPLASDEVTAYVDHRLWVAGYKGSSLFSVGARTLLAEYSEGIPRNINNLCFCAMALGWATKQNTIDREMMRDVLTEANLGPLKATTDSASKSVDPPKQSVVQNIRPAVFTVKKEPSRGWLPKVLLACAVLFALGWSGAHFDIGNRLADLWHGMSPPEKSSVIPLPASITPDQGTPAGSERLSSGTGTNAPTDNKDSMMPKEGGAQPTTSIQESR